MLMRHLLRQNLYLNEHFGYTLFSTTNEVRSQDGIPHICVLSPHIRHDNRSPRLGPRHGSASLVAGVARLVPRHCV